MGFINEKAIAAIEARCPQGLTSAEVLELCEHFGKPLSEASLRKYVQLGLLPRSVRVGEKGKHRGSKGMYPVRIVRLIVLIRELMDGHLTIEQIQNDVLFLRDDLDQLEERLDSIFGSIESRLCDSELPQQLTLGAKKEKEQAQAVGKELLEGLRLLEQRLSGGYLSPQLKPEQPNQRSRRLLAEEEESMVDVEQLSVG
jgi:hypothetical protein